MEQFVHRNVLELALESASNGCSLSVGDDDVVWVFLQDARKAKRTSTRASVPVEADWKREASEEHGGRRQKERQGARAFIYQGRLGSRIVHMSRPLGSIC